MLTARCFPMAGANRKHRLITDNFILLRRVLDTLLNPTLIVEVLSPSTEAWDRGRKFISYTSITSFSEYLLVSQDAVLVERRVRLAPQEWRQRFFHHPGGSVTLGAGIVLPLSAIYAGTKLLG